MLDYRDYYDYDKVKFEIIEGVYVIVCVEYIIYWVVVLVDVGFILKFKEDGDKIGIVVVFGIVLVKRNYICIEFVRFLNEFVKVKLGIFMVLSRFVVVVLVYLSF